MTKRARQRPEEVIQRYCVGVLRAYVPSPPEGPFWTAINPVSIKSKVAAGVSKGMGMRAGVPDLLLIHRGRAVFVEFKAPKGGLSAVQRSVRDELLAAGAEFTAAKSVDDFLGILEHHGVPCSIRRDRTCLERAT